MPDCLNYFDKVISRYCTDTYNSNLTKNKMSKSSNPDESYAHFFLKNLRQLREENVLIDISFTQSNTTIKGHRVILAALSPVLRSIFTKKQQTMSADHISPDSLSCLVNFVYQNESLLDINSFNALLKTSELLSIKPVHHMTSKAMSKLNIKQIDSNGNILQPDPNNDSINPANVNSSTFQTENITGGVFLD